MRPLPTIPGPLDAVTAKNGRLPSAATIEAMRSVAAELRGDVVRRDDGTIRGLCFTHALESIEAPGEGTGIAVLVRRDDYGTDTHFAAVPLAATEFDAHWTHDVVGLARWIVDSAIAAAERVGDGVAGEEARSAYEDAAAHLAAMTVGVPTMRRPVLTAASGSDPATICNFGDPPPFGIPKDIAGADSGLAAGTLPGLLALTDSSSDKLGFRIVVDRLHVVLDEVEADPMREARAIREAHPAVVTLARSIVEAAR